MLRNFKKSFESIGVKERESTDKRLAINTFNWILLSTFIAGLTWAFLLFFLEQYKAFIFPLISAFSIPLILFYFARTRNFTHTLNAFLLMLLTLPAFVQFFHGGFINSGAVVTWSVVAPLTSLAFKPKRESIRCFLFFIAVVTLTSLAELFIPVDYHIMTNDVIILQFTMNFIGVVSICFFPMLSFSGQLKEARDRLKEKNSKIINSINYAKYIQSATLFSPAELKTLFNNNCFLYYRPKDIVSGDFYWAYENKDYIFVACSDCTGHGVPGAFMTMMGINHLNSIVRENHEEDPAIILKHLHEKVMSSLKNATKTIHDGMDMTICKIHKTRKTLEYSSAMSKIYHFDGEKIIRCLTDKATIGDSRRETVFTNHTLQLKEGDMIYLTTDGYLDQFGGEKDKKYGTRRLLELLLSVARQPVSVQRKELADQFISWKGTQEQIDDVTFIGIRF